jgi:hypothetical protein
VTIIPIIYGISEQDFVNTKIAKMKRLIIANIHNVKEGLEVACKSPLSKYGVI